MEDAKMTAADGRHNWHNIRVICDNPRHARGKIAEIITYWRDNEGQWFAYKPPKMRRGAKRGQKLRAAGVKPTVDDIYGTSFDDLKAPCKLCGQRLPLGFDIAGGDIKILNEIAAKGESEISLTRLHALASRQR